MKALEQLLAVDPAVAVAIQILELMQPHAVPPRSTPGANALAKLVVLAPVDETVAIEVVVREDRSALRGCWLVSSRHR